MRSQLRGWTPEGLENAMHAVADADASVNALAEVRRVAEGEENLLPPMRDALRAGVTIGEICNELREVFSTYDAQRSPR